MNRGTESLVSGTVLLVLRQGLSALLNALSIFVILRWLSPTDFGLLSILIAASSLLGLLAFNADDAILRFVPVALERKRLRAAWHLTLLLCGLRIASGILLTFALWGFGEGVFSLFLSHPKLPALVWGGGWLVLTITVRQLVQAVFLVQRRYWESAYLALLLGMTQLILSCFAFYLDASLENYFLASSVLQLTLSAISLLVSLFFLRGKIQTAQARETSLPDLWPLGPVFRYSLPLWASNLIFAPYQYLSQLVLGFFVPLADVGYFSFAKEIVQQISNLYYQIPLAVVPELSARSEGGNLHNSFPTLLSIHRVALVSTLAVAVVLALTAQELCALFGGTEYVAAAYLLQIFALQLLFRVPTNFMGSLFMVSDQSRAVFSANLLRLLLLVLSMIVFVPSFGIEAAAWAEAGVFAVILVYFTCLFPTQFSGIRKLLFIQNAEVLLLGVFVVAVGMLLDWYGASIAERGSITLAVLAAVFWIGLTEWRKLDLQRGANR